MSKDEEQRRAARPDASTQRLTVCRCGRICSDYPRCRHPDRRGETPPETPDEPARGKGR